MDEWEDVCKRYWTIRGDRFTFLIYRPIAIFKFVYSSHVVVFICNLYTKESDKQMQYQEISIFFFIFSRYGIRARVNIWCSLSRMLLASLPSCFNHQVIVAIDRSSEVVHLWIYLCLFNRFILRSRTRIEEPRWTRSRLHTTLLVSPGRPPQIASRRDHHKAFAPFVASGNSSSCRSPVSLSCRVPVS